MPAGITTKAPFWFRLLSKIVSLFGADLTINTGSAYYKYEIHITKNR